MCKDLLRGPRMSLIARQRTLAQPVAITAAAISLACGIGAVVSGCADSVKGSSTSANARRPPPLPLTPREKRDLQRRLRQEIERARALKKSELVRNSRLFDSVVNFPGSERIREGSGPVTLGIPSTSKRDRLFDDYAAAVLSIDEYLAMTASIWVTERDYLAPKGVPATRVRDFFVAQLAKEWSLTHEERGTGRAAMRENGIGFYELSFFKDDHCLKIRVGTPVPHLRNVGRGIELAISRRERQSC